MLTSDRKLLSNTIWISLKKTMNELLKLNEVTIIVIMKSIEDNKIIRMIQDVIIIDIISSIFI